MAEADDWNRKISEEFRHNAGRVGGPLEGMPMILVHSTGAKSGAERVHPMVYQAVGDAWAVFASKAGAPTNPDWYHNLVAHPNATAEVGTDTVRATSSEGLPGALLGEGQGVAVIAVAVGGSCT